MRSPGSRVQQLLLRHQDARAFGQMDEHGPGFGTERDRRARPGQLAGAQVEPKRGEDDAVRAFRLRRTLHAHKRSFGRILP